LNPGSVQYFVFIVCNLQIVKHYRTLRFELFSSAGTVVVFRFVMSDSGWNIPNEFGGLRHAREFLSFVPLPVYLHEDLTFFPSVSWYLRKRISLFNPRVLQTAKFIRNISSVDAKLCIVSIKAQCFGSLLLCLLVKIVAQNIKTANTKIFKTIPVLYIVS
jgi:hypothetical protein